MRQVCGGGLAFPNADALVLGVPGDFAPLIEQDAALAQIPVTTFSLTDPAADVTATPANAQHTAFAMRAGGQPLGDLSLAINGDFNYANAAAAIALAHAYETASRIMRIASSDSGVVRSDSW